MNIVIADDHSLFRSGVRELLAQAYPGSTVTEAGDLDDMLGVVPLDAPPDLLIIDLNMPGVDGVESIAALVDIFPNAKLIIMSGCEGRREIGAALAAGVNGYIPKTLGAGEILTAVRNVMGGSTYVPLTVTRREAMAQKPSNTRINSDEVSLTERQRHVLDELLQGKSSKEIGRTLDITESTVKVHLAALYRTLGVRSRSEVIAKMKRPSLARA